MSEVEFAEYVNTGIRAELRAAHARNLEDDFRAMCDDHDITYRFDDGAGYFAGAKEALAIVLAAAELPRAVAVRIFNEAVDKQIRPHARADYYWSE